MEIININLGDFKHKDTKIFSGHQGGLNTRINLNLKYYDKQEDVKIEFIVPEDTFAICTSYLLPLFGESIRFLGEEKFRQKYKLISQNRMIEKAYNQGIIDALTDN